MGAIEKARLSVFNSIFVPILTCGHESWVLTKSVTSKTQASEMRVLRKIKGVAMFDKLSNTVIREFLNIESLLLRTEKF